LELPATWQVSSRAEPSNVDRASLVYSASTEGKNGSLFLNRELTVEALLVKRQVITQAFRIFSSRCVPAMKSK